MPRMTSCWIRISRSPPYSRAESSRSQGAFSARSVSSRNSRTRPSRTRQTAASTVRSPSGTAVTHGRPSGRQRGLDRRLGPRQPLVALLLPAVVGHPLVEVALRVHEADADERHAQVARLLAVIAGQHAEAAGVDRQRLVQGELGREIGDGAAVHGVAVLAPPGLDGPRTSSRRATAASYIRQEAQRRPRPVAAARRNLLQHLHRVVIGAAPERVVEAAEDFARASGPSSTTRSTASSCRR